jgi:hypothetical protein
MFRVAIIFCDHTAVPHQTHTSGEPIMRILAHVGEGMMLRHYLVQNCDEFAIETDGNAALPRTNPSDRPFGVSQFDAMETPLPIRMGRAFICTWFVVPMPNLCPSGLQPIQVLRLSFTLPSLQHLPLSHQQSTLTTPCTDWHSAEDMSVIWATIVIVLSGYCISQ